MSAADIGELQRVRESAEVVFNRAQIETALDSMANAIARDVSDQDPVLLCIMNGGVVLAGELLTRLQFPLRLDYAHVSRYREKTQGEELIWIRRPETSLENQAVLIVDDILDEGHTLSALIDFCREQGARSIFSAVLVDKDRQRENPVVADYVGLVAPDRYLFGCGMDYKGYWRNSNVIYAI